MLRTVSPNISIITNFGCRSNCWYCIWKGHPLENVRHQTDWNKLDGFLFDNKSKGKVSISGGGDSLYKYHDHEKWWDQLFEITNRYSMLVDIHTREKFVDPKFWCRINRVSFSSDKLENDIDYLKYLAGLTKIRITHLVTANTTFDMIDDYITFQKNIGCQFTIKELVGYDDAGMYVKVRKKYPNIFNLDAGDYNIYYMPDNTIRNKFLF